MCALAFSHQRVDLFIGLGAPIPPQPHAARRNDAGGGDRTQHKSPRELRLAGRLGLEVVKVKRTARHPVAGPWHGLDLEQTWASLGGDPANAVDDPVEAVVANPGAA